MPSPTDTPLADALTSRSGDVLLVYGEGHERAPYIARGLLSVFERSGGDELLFVVDVPGGLLVVTAARPGTCRGSAPSAGPAYG